MAYLNESQSRAIRCSFQDIHRRLVELEALITPGGRPSAFSEYVNDLSPTEAKVLQDYFALIRTAMLGHLREFAVSLDVRQTSLRWALQCGIAFIGNTVADLRPAKLRGYGTLDGTASAEIARTCEDLERLVDQVAACLRQGLGRDWRDRLTRLGEAHVGIETLSSLEVVIGRWQLVEFRPAFERIVGRLEAPCFEIAVFGRVSSGKSSLLNHIAGIDALPVGVTPVTAVPTRLVSGDRASVVVSFADSQSHCVGLEQLWEYASEEGNPANQRHVTSVLVRLPSPRLREGIVFVDTPGVGSLALAGGAETIAYLPRCDLGVVLVDSASILDQEDLALLRALGGAAIPAMVLLSKADLLAPGDRVKIEDYTREQLRRELGLDLPVQPVSTVGADESLLTAWFEKELAALLDQHQSLAETSLKRKIGHLRESVIATLETMLAKRTRGRLGDGHRVDTTAAQRLLNEADETIRHTRERSQNWWADRRTVLETVLGLTAQAVVSAKDLTGTSDFAGAIEELLLERGRAALDLISGLQDTLAKTLEGLPTAAPLAHADPSSIRDFHAGGLPTVNLDGIRAEKSRLRPWWTRIAPPLAVRAVERTIRERFGNAIEAAVEFHDRQLELWVKAKLAPLVELYETQAGAFREQIRRLATERDDTGTASEEAALEADLRELREAEADREAAPEQPGLARMAR